MKPTSKLALFVLKFLTLAVTAFAEEPSPRWQFQTAVEAYQKTPTHEAALKVIELYKQLDPAPAVPEEARRPFVMGVTVLKKANDKVGATKAVEFFTEAVKTAPWFAEAYYNRALAREMTGQFTEAMDDLKLYLVFTLSDAERREAQDKIYSLEADVQLATAKKTEEQKAAAAKAATKPAGPDFSGKWADKNYDPLLVIMDIEKDGDGWIIRYAGAEIVSVVKVQGRQLWAETSFYKFHFILSQDAQTLELVRTQAAGGVSHWTMNRK